ncbi:hypothetical protein ACQPZP_20510 [Spirillospora sp. CA-142024]|uniref:hypothetical protein n=1 Tax=Spirillospora sp. CA-142024 TaxID=3240036 RepID=UPI003D943EC7
MSRDLEDLGRHLPNLRHLRNLRRDVRGLGKEEREALRDALRGLDPRDLKDLGRELEDLGRELDR